MKECLLKEVISVLEDLRDYFDSYSEVDCDQDGYIPNEEMRKLILISEILEKAKAVQ